MSPVAHRFSVWAYNKHRNQYELQSTHRTLSLARAAERRFRRKHPKLKTQLVDRQKRGGSKTIHPKPRRPRYKTPPHKTVTIFGRKGVFIDWAAWGQAKKTAAHNLTELNRVRGLLEAATRQARVREDKIDELRAKAAADIKREKQTMAGITDNAEQTAKLVTDPAFWRMIQDSGVALTIEEKRRRALVLAGYGVELIEREELVLDKDRFLTALRAAGFSWHAAYDAWFGY